VVNDWFKVWNEQTKAREKIKQMMRERAERPKELLLFFIEEIRRSLNSFLGNLSVAPDQMVRVQSEDEARNRIGRDPIIRRLPGQARELAVEMALNFCLLALDEARNRLGLLRARLNVLTERHDQLLYQLGLVNQKLRPLVAERIANLPTPPPVPQVNLIPIDQDKIKQDTEQSEKAKMLQRKTKKPAIATGFFGLLAITLSYIDGNLTYLVIAACYEGTEWYFKSLVYFLTASMVVMMVWAGHQITRRGFWGIAFLALGTLAMGYLRVEIGGGGAKDLSSLSLAAINVLPIPVISYLAAVCFNQAYMAFEEFSRRYERLDKELFPLRCVRALTGEIEWINRRNNTIINDRNATVNNNNRRYQDIQQRFLETEQSQAVEQLRAISQWYEQTSRDINEGVIETLRPMARIHARKLAQVCEDEEEILERREEPDGEVVWDPNSIPVAPGMRAT
jgi:hypothetical protein